ncbi:MAG: phosphopantetheine adenylyltransferase [Candidatus Hydrothermarchaeaceae archaeon]
MFKKVAVGGTFDRLHKGHKALLRRAFELGEKVVVGITSDEMLQKEADPLPVRMEELGDFLSGLDYDLVVLEDPHGPSITDPEIDAIVVTEDTEPRAMEINSIRSKRNMMLLKIIVIKKVLAQDGKPISSTRVRRGEIDGDGVLQ